MKKTVVLLSMVLLLGACSNCAFKKGACPKSNKRVEVDVFAACVEECNKKGVCSDECLVIVKEAKGKKMDKRAWGKRGMMGPGPACKCDPMKKGSCPMMGKDMMDKKFKKCPNCKPFKATECVKPMPMRAAAPAPVKPVEVVVKPMPTHVDDLKAVAAVKETDKGIKLTFNAPILFNTNSDVMKEESKPEVAKIAKILAKHPNAQTVVEGYTDSMGDPAYNKDLSERRAKSVVNALIADGVKAENVSAKGFGATNFIDTNSTSAGRANNRRVELDITTTK